MQIELLDSYAILPFGASAILFLLSAAFLIRLRSSRPVLFSRKVLFFLPLFLIVTLFLASAISLFYQGSFPASTGIFLSSLVISVMLISISKKDDSPENDAQGSMDDKNDGRESSNEASATKQDPLVGISQNFLLQVSETLAGEVNPVRLLDYVNEIQIQNTEADGGVIFLTDDFDDIILSKSFKGSFPPPYKLPSDLPHKPLRVETNFKYVQFNLGESIFGEVALHGKSILIEDGTADKRVHINGPEEFLIPGSYIVVPLIVRDRVVGVSALARLPGKTAFTKENLRIAESIGQFAGAAINNIYSIQEVLEHADLEREASIAAKIQKTLHPKRLPELPEVGFGSFFNAAKGVCGDYFDIILARKDRIAVVIGDVAGKGIQSSMVMMMVRSILQLVTNTTKDAGTILDWVNKGITGKIDLDHYATLSYVCYSPSTHTIEVASAGSQSLLVWRDKTKKMETVRQKTDPIGIERASRYETTKLTAEKGDIIILFTDGLIEALNSEGKQYGIDSLSEVIISRTASSAKDIASEVKHNIQEFLGSASLHDDQTLVIMKIKA